MYLADASALIVFLSNENPERVMPAATLMRTHQVGVLPITVWEITRKAGLGKLPRFWDPWPSLAALLSEQNYRTQAFTWEDAEAANDLPDIHRDPMDRMVIAAALRADLTVITSDRIFRAYNVKTVW